MAFSALRSFLCESGIFRCATSSSNTSRIPQARSRGVSPSTIPATRASGCSQPHPVWAGSDKWTAPVWPALFCRQLCFPGCFLGQLLLFHLPLWWRGDIDDGFPAADRRLPSVFRFSVSTGRFCSVMLCSASDESSSCGQRYHTRHSARTPSTAR